MTFEQLDQVPWAELTHAYGSAADVPDMLRSLVAEHPGERQDAFMGLYSTIYHQGSLYSATPHAVPFLAQIAADQRYPNRRELLLYLAHLGLIQRYPRKEPEAGYIAATAQALERHAPQLLPALRAVDPRVRLAASCALAWCGPAASAALAQQLPQEFDHKVRAAQLIALGLHRALPAEARPLGAEDLAAHTLALLATSGTAIEQQELDRAIEVLNDAASVDLLATLLAQDCREALGDLTLCLSELPAPIVERVIPPLCAALEQLSDERAGLGLAEWLLARAFPQTLGERVPFAQLTSTQQQVLRSVAQSEAAWGIGGNMSYALRHALGFTGKQDELLSYVDDSVVAMVITPLQHHKALELCERLAEERGWRWHHVPWVFTSGSSDALEQRIPEDPADFPPQVMEKASQIAGVLYHFLVKPGHPRLRAFRFYPLHSADDLRQICAELGWTLVEPAGMQEPPQALPPRATSTPGIAYGELSEEQRALAEDLAATLDQHGWREARSWLGFARAAPSIHVSPIVIGKLTGDAGPIEAELWLYDEWRSAQAGERVGRPYVKLSSFDGEEALTLRCYDADLRRPLATIVRLGRAISPRAIPTLLLELIPACEQVAIDQGDGSLMQVSLPER